MCDISKKTELFRNHKTYILLCIKMNFKKYCIKV